MSAFSLRCPGFLHNEVLPSSSDHQALPDADTLVLPEMVLGGQLLLLGDEMGRSSPRHVQMKGLCHQGDMADVSICLLSESAIPSFPVCQLHDGCIHSSSWLL